MNLRIRSFTAAIFLTGSLLIVAEAQNKSGPGVGDAGRPPGTRPSIPLVRVKGQPAMNDFPGFGGSRSGARVASPPAVLSPDQRTRLLRESGVDVRPESTPREFRLSPRAPYASSSAYLYFQGNVEFNASGDSLLLHIVERGLPSPRIVIPGIGETRWDSAGPQPDPPGFVGLLVRMDPRSRYLADFSVSADRDNNYQLTATGAEGTGNFGRAAGGQHLLVALESTDGGYVRIALTATSAFTFHNVVVTKLD